ncbi:fosmidomycin resistance protein [Clostridium magnum DSM 2767]|uniref:Fosmidomycin resistance protein n=1 Tax=Clostridium magnum DSM 2767 TaxID=1121326 RepID=A0A161Y3L4_9CLOT|nr:fosmidomycin resistance protein [Clostridium magnum DSM 2767]SHI24168.1 Transcriptional regulator PadR-like family protein [Clostridium magnum DSM 2767]
MIYRSLKDMESDGLVETTWEIKETGKPPKWNNITKKGLEKVDEFAEDIRKRWLAYIGTLWMATMLSLTGLVHNYSLLVVLASLAGLGTAVFHPQASTMVNVLSRDRKAVLLSVFVAFGNFGFALSPLLLVPLLQAYGLKVTVVMVIPGIIVS